MAKNAWFGGAPLQQIGQSKVEIKPTSLAWDVDTNWLTLGKTDHNNFSEVFEWADLTNLQYGSRMANSQITGQGVMGELGLVEMYAEVFEKIWPGAKVIRWGNGTLKQIVAKRAVGARLTDYLFWYRFTQYRNGKPSTRPLDQVYALMAARFETGEINADLSPQVVTVPLVGFEASEDYVSTPVLDPDDGQPLMFWTAERDEYDEYA